LCFKEFLCILLVAVNGRAWLTGFGRFGYCCSSVAFQTILFGADDPLRVGLSVMM
jgi:hypothetical protein